MLLSVILLAFLDFLGFVPTEIVHQNIMDVNLYRISIGKLFNLIY